MINQIHTNCRDCAFAEYSKGSQVGCSAGLIEKYRSAGKEIIEVYDDNNKEFYVVNDKICHFHRDKEWADKYPKSELFNIVKAQIKTPYHCIIVLKEHDKLDDLAEMMKNLASQFNPPSVVSVLNMKVGKKIYKLNMDIEAIAKNYEDKFEWRIQNILRSNISIRSGIDHCVDGTYFKYNYPYYIVFSCGFQIPPSFSEELHDSIIYDGEQPIFAQCVDDDLNGMLVNKLMHRKHTGNAFEIPIEEKIKSFEPDAANYFYNIKDLCPSMG